MSERIRWSVSLRARDYELIQYFSNIGSGDRSAECRKLMLLGLQSLDSPPPQIEPRVRNTPSTVPKKDLDSRLDALI